MRWIGFALAFLTIVTGASGQSADRPWNFEGSSGKIQFDAAELSWFHIAYPDGPHPYNVNLNVKWEYNSTHYPFGFSASYLWVSEEGEIEDTLPQGIFANDYLAATNNTLGVWTPLENLLAPVDSPVQDVTFQLGQVVSQLPGDWTPSMASILISRRFDHNSTAGFERPVKHFVFVNLTPIPTSGPVNVTVEWENAPVVMTWGTNRDHFAYGREQFSGVQAGAKLGGVQAYAADDVSLATNLVDSKPAAYWFWPRACAGTCEAAPAADGKLTKPGGLTQTGEILAGSTNTTGIWTFDVPGHAKVEWEAPVLFGVRHEHPVFPWQEGFASVVSPPLPAVVPASVQGSGAALAKDSPESTPRGNVPGLEWWCVALCLGWYGRFRRT